MFGYSSPRRQNRNYANESYNQNARAQSPINGANQSGYANDRPQSANAPVQRDRSNSNAAQGGYYFQPYSAPYVDNKKNGTFINPNLVSNNVFYDHNYGYKNDFANDRLLSPVRYDRHNQNRATVTPPKQRPEVNDERFSRSQNVGPRKLETDDSYADRKANMKSVDNRGAPENNYRRRNSGGAQQEENVNAGGNAQKPDEDAHSVRSGGRVASPAGYRKGQNNAYSIRDDRSEASTVVSTLSTDGYVCPRCLNRHMASDRAASCMASRRDDQERERKNQTYAMRLQEEERARQMDEKARRVEDSRNTANQLENDYHSRMEARRSPKRDVSSNLNNLFGKQDELRERQKAVSEMFRNSLKEQIRGRADDKEKERAANAMSYNTSLNFANPYQNKYLDDRNTVNRKLQEQIDDKSYRNKAEKERDQRQAWDLHERSMRNLEEEERDRREKQWFQRRELQDAYKQKTDEKKAKEIESAHNRDAERNRLEADYDEYRRRQQEEYAKNQSKAYDFKQGLLNQMSQSSYRKMYEKKLQQGGPTSFDPKHHSKKKYPCGECSTLYEKPYLTKLG